MIHIEAVSFYVKHYFPTEDATNGKVNAIDIEVWFSTKDEGLSYRTTILELLE